jgi:hypothetical protein
VVVSFIGRENQNTGRKPPACVYIFSINSCIELIKHVQICTKHLTIAAMMDHVINTITQTMSTKHNNISVILWWSVLLVEKTRIPGENHQPVASH